jgi:hypothetical protein
MMGKFWIPNMNKIRESVQAPLLHTHTHTDTYRQMRSKKPLSCSGELKISVCGKISRSNFSCFVYEKVKSSNFPTPGSYRICFTWFS